MKISTVCDKMGLVKPSIRNTILSINNQNLSHQSVEYRCLWQFDFESGTFKCFY